ncbi:hypothetical protein Y032_0108g41 [Ancylostoma ceylanicum]|uniref:Uncharacterized protein n=1 Tax=Ancylostoma ceylanicum TaxID=53326 RepID=A0A016TF85_9BILA|nr:hypothetical protein Y032_0108g41 [Ancylostoma ceylanicum]
MSEKRLDIQGLRGWSIILVVLFHFFPNYFPNGYIGVDMFFVISGFLIAMILGRVEKLDVKSVCTFYYRRYAKKKKLSWETLLPFISFCFFALTIVVPFVSIKIPEDALRVYVTGFSAILILVGKRHQNLLLSNPAIVYIGDISYALYLFHWPAYIIAKFFILEIPFALLLGLLASVVLAVAIHHCFEKFYRKWSPTVILIVIIALSTSCVLLTLYNVGDSDLGSGPVDYTEINPNDAAWNMTLMRYLNFVEGNRDNFELENLGCVYSNSRFTFEEDYKPLGFCSMEEGSGGHDFLVIGNSFACNQADMIFKAFGKYARRFNIHCRYICEVMVQTPNPACGTLLNLTAMIEELKPDVVFVIERSLQLKTGFNTRNPIDDDKTFKDLMERVTDLEERTKKVYILQAIPSCKMEWLKIAHILQRPLKEMKEGLVTRDDFFARLRIHEVEKRCRTCEVIDYLPMLVDENGHYLGYNPDNNLVFIDYANHLTRYSEVHPGRPSDAHLSATTVSCELFAITVDERPLKKAIQSKRQANNKLFHLKTWLAQK